MREARRGNVVELRRGVLSHLAHLYRGGCTRMRGEALGTDARSGEQAEEEDDIFVHCHY